jgi:hypothetical protein
VSHAHHFLERLDRVSREQTEFALTLYRDHEAVAYILDHAKVAVGAQRVALSIEDPKEGPFVIVSRDGHFVTCLGAGMHHAHPVVPRGQIDALMDKVRDKRARREIAERELRPDEDRNDLFQRILTRGSRLTKEDFIAVSAFEPLLGLGPFVCCLDLGVDASKMRLSMVHAAARVQVKGSSKVPLERLDRMEWAVAHLMMLAGAADRDALDTFLANTQHVRCSPTVGCAAQIGSTFFLRGAWVAARFGKAVIPNYKAALAESKDWIAFLDAALCLGAIGLRHSGSMGEVRRILESYDGTNHETIESAARAVFSKWVLDSLDHVDERTAAAEKIGREFCVAYGKHLPEGHPLHFATAEDVPLDLAHTASLAFDGDMHDQNIQGFVFTALPLAARAPAEDFYFPRDVVRAWFGQWSAEESLERLQRFARAIKKKPEATAKAPVIPGRNEPCPCGSGKKYKKCHGGPTPVAGG